MAGRSAPQCRLPHLVQRFTCTAAPYERRGLTDIWKSPARFLREQRALIGLRRELPPKSAPWVPGGAAAQSPPNSRSAHAGQ
jgi:hypothetical protein